MVATILDSDSSFLLGRDGFVRLGTLETGALDDLRLVASSEISAAGLRQRFAVASENLPRIARALPVPASHHDVLGAVVESVAPLAPGAQAGQRWQSPAVVGEPNGRLCVMYVSLDDETGSEGQLRVVRNSHRITQPLRPVGRPFSVVGHEKRLNRIALDIPLAAGDMVMMDAELIWSRHPNHSTRTRTGLYVILGDSRFESGRDGDSAAASPHELIGRIVDLDLDRAIGARTAESSPASQDDRGSLRDWIGYQRTFYSTRVARVDAVRRSPLLLADAVRRSPLLLADTVASVARAVASMQARGRSALAGCGELRNGTIRWVRKIRELVEYAPSGAALALLSVNEWVISTIGPKTPAVWDPATFEWTAEVERAWPQIRDEVQSLLTHRKEIPHIEDVTGGIPQGNDGVWRTFVLMHQGVWIDWNCSRCPNTTAVVKRIPQLSMAGFSVLEPGTHITEHRGPNKGALRYQLGVIVPGERGDCRIRVGDEMIHWADGESVVFDFTVRHEAWNDTSETRVLLMLEFHTPLPWYLAIPNARVQRCMAWFPTTRDLKKRLLALEPTL